MRPLWRTSVPSGNTISDTPFFAACNQRVGVLGAALHVEALDEHRADASHQRAAEEIVRELALGDEGVVAPGQRRDQHRAVEVARVVRGDDVRAVRQVLEPAHRERNAAQPEEEPQAALRDVPGGPPRRDQGAAQHHHQGKAEDQPCGEREEHALDGAPSAAQLRPDARQPRAARTARQPTATSPRSVRARSTRAPPRAGSCRSRSWGRCAAARARCRPPARRSARRPTR